MRAPFAARYTSRRSWNGCQQYVVRIPIIDDHTLLHKFRTISVYRDIPPMRCPGLRRVCSLLILNRCAEVRIMTWTGLCLFVFFSFVQETSILTPKPL